MTYLDTHAAVWMYAGRVELFPPPVRELLASEELLVSPTLRLLQEALFEIGRLGEGGRAVRQGLEALVGLRVCDRPFRQVVAGALEQSWTRDPFDRLIVAQAALTDAVLVTKDQSIRDHYPRAFWAER